MFDLIIRGGLVADGQSQELEKLDVAIRDGLIADVAPSIQSEGARIIEAGGKVVAPGFVDVHSHSDYYLLIDPRARSKVTQGVTTEIGGNCGYSAAPMSGETLRQRAKDYEAQFGIKVDWAGMGEYLRRLEDARPAVNFAALIGYNTVRGSILGPNSSRPGSDGMRKIKDMMGRALDEGALGMSVGVVYPPACFASAEEFIEAASVVAARGYALTSHIRSEGASLLEALEEMVTVAKGSGVKLQVSHLKTAGKDNWGKLDRAFGVLEDAMAQGVRVMADRYPYLASNTGLQVTLPDRAFDGGKDALAKKLADPSERAAFTGEILKNHPEPEYWDTVMISQVVTEANKDLEGLTVTQGAQTRGKDVFSFIYDLLIQENTDVEAIFFCMSEYNLSRILEKPWVVVGSDSGARAIDGPLAIGRPHPRTFGTFPKFFREFVREKKVFTIPEAVRKTSTQALEFFGIGRRGRIKKGCFADIVVFDPDTIGDTATYTDPMAHSKGIEYVLVNGVFAVERGRPTENRAGHVITG